MLLKQLELMKLVRPQLVLGFTILAADLKDK